MWLMMMLMTVPSFAGKKADLQREAEELRALVSTLQAQVEELKGVPKRGEQHELEAAELIKQASEHMERMEKMEALVVLGKVLADYSDTQALSRAQRLLRALDVLGKDSIPYNDHSKRWVVGSASDVGPANEGLHLVVFFEAWCPHCEREMPKLEELYQQVSKNGVKVIGVTKRTHNTTEKALNRFIKKGHITYPIFEEDGGLMDGYKLTGVPSAVATMDGEVVWLGHPMDLTVERVENWQQKAGKTNRERREREAAELIDEARVLVQTSKKEEAVELLNRVKEEYPGTRAIASIPGVLTPVKLLGISALPYKEHFKKCYSSCETELTPADEGVHLLFFFNPRSLHSQRYAPEVEELFQRYSSEGLKVVGITNRSLGTTEEAISAFIKDSAITFPAIEEDGELTATYYANGTKAVVLKNGEVVWRGRPSHITQELVEGWLKKK